MPSTDHTGLNEGVMIGLQCGSAEMVTINIKDLPQLPPDPSEQVVQEIYRSYGHGAEAFGMVSFVRLMVHTVLEMKRRGLI